MIKQWRIGNFKSFNAPSPISFEQINIMAGANSSGKSSIIQSILLLKQTLQYGSANRAVALNGPLLRLGAFDDVQHFGSAPSPVSIGFDIELDDQDLRRPNESSWMRLLRRHSGASERNVKVNVRLDITFNQIAVNQDSLLPISSTSGLAPRLNTTKLVIDRVSSDGSTQTSYVDFKHRPTVDASLDDIQTFSQYDVSLDSEGLREICGSRTEATQKGGYNSYFLPSWIVINYNEAADEVIRIANYIVSSDRNFTDSAYSEESLSDSVINVINEWLLAHNEPSLIEDGDVIRAGTARSALAKFTSNGMLFIGGLISSLKKDDPILVDINSLKDQIIRNLILETEPDYSYELETPKAIKEATEFIKEFFKSGVRYLGPLRDSPRPVYQPEALESTTDVGYRGEHTAAILDLNGNRSVVYHRPPLKSTEHDYVKLTTQRRAPLQEAVVEWLQYLGVADNVVTTDAGVYGNRLQVSTSGVGRLHDLTNVGVGVSQVLPIVVMALLAPKGSFLIFEQPELHLHPKVQARLADFFLALSKDGKQTLLETHSEYLVDRLRLRIALSSDDKTRSEINILFSEKSSTNSTLTPVEISEFGAITNWPKDFFEQSQNDISRLIEAAAARRRSLKRDR